MISKVNASKYCCEDISLIENYEEAVYSKELYHCHHRLEIQGNIIRSATELKEQNLYYNRPASELIFIPIKAHMGLHYHNHKYKDNSDSDDYFYNKLTQEQKNRISREEWVNFNEEYLKIPELERMKMERELCKKNNKTYWLDDFFKH